MRKGIFTGLFWLVVLGFLTAVPALAAMDDDDFFALCFDGTPQQIRAALADGAKVDARGPAGEGLHWTMLTCVVANKANDSSTPEIVDVLINKGADVNARDEDGVTALMRAAYANENPAVIATLIRAGAAVKARDKQGWTAMVYAAMHNVNPEVIKALLAAGAEVNARDKKGASALMYAAKENANPHVIEALLAAGADTQVRDKKGKRAADYAADNEPLRDSAVYRRLQQPAGANPAPAGTQPQLKAD